MELFYLAWPKLPAVTLMLCKRIRNQDVYKLFNPSAVLGWSIFSLMIRSVKGNHSNPVSDRWRIKFKAGPQKNGGSTCELIFL